VFEVADTGTGIAPGELPHIFDRFYRADKARARETGGSGLGLAIAQRLTEMQGGCIWASSTVGSGTTFYVALPQAPRL
jgi:two-component system sensor histidine kinase BaeS